MMRLTTSPAGWPSMYFSGRRCRWRKASSRMLRTVRKVMRLLQMDMIHWASAVRKMTMAMRRKSTSSASKSTWPAPMIRSTASPVSTGRYSVSATEATAKSSESTM